MKKLSVLLVFMVISSFGLAQNSANRFFYELSYIPNVEIDSTEKTMTVLDVSTDKSIYRDYTMLAQDSLLKAKVEQMQKTGVFVEVEKFIQMPKFGYRIIKEYPAMEIKYVDGIEKNLFGYGENVDLKWKIHKETKVINSHTAQKATTEYRGRNWTAWFTTDIPIQEGPFKFHGLPGLILKLNDDQNHYSWELVANEKISDYNENAYSDLLYYGDNITPKIIEKEKFLDTYSKYKKDPLASLKGQLSPEMMTQQMPGSNVTYGDMIISQEKILMDLLNGNTNPIEKE